ncbi:hypothetical protein Q8A67_025481 [Cirrhinus molitorella]|uniref:Uncharacterized protein n=1 Tax=Cirrhinus molitorella TaxID=172907 RepID=A0AA88P0M5_9TELE|nr:hypothetical protein Q8A67_025481 [Cirrhinus molitorella]
MKGQGSGFTAERGPWKGDGGLLGSIKGGQGLAFTGLPTCSSSPGALVQLGDSDAGFPALGMENVQDNMRRDKMAGVE